MKSLIIAISLIATPCFAFEHDPECSTINDFEDLQIMCDAGALHRPELCKKLINPEDKTYCLKVAQNKHD